MFYTHTEGFAHTKTFVLAADEGTLKLGEVVDRLNRQEQVIAHLEKVVRSQQALLDAAEQVIAALAAEPAAECRALVAKPAQTNAPAALARDP